jgi:peptidylprolyl isomerase
LRLYLIAVVLAALGLALPANAQPPPTPKLEPENTLVIELRTGKVTIQLRPDIAPQHVARIKELTRAGFFNGIVFHRVIENFMAQTGDPTGTGRGGSGKPPIPAEFSSVPFERGTVGAARTTRDSADSQFFIVLQRSPHLNREYTLWGRVVDGMQHVDQIARGEPPAKPDKMLKVYILADQKK